MSCRNYLQRIISFIYPSVYILEGTEKNSKSPLTFAYIGTGLNTQLEQYWTQITLCEDFRRQDMGRLFVWNVFSFLRKSPIKCDFLLVEDYLLTSRLFYKIPRFKVPYWVGMGINIESPIEKLFGSQRRVIQRKIRKNRLSYVMVKDKESFDDFYYNMFLPYISKRHDSKAYLTPYKELWDMFSRGGLIFIKKKEKIVAGGLFEFDGQEVQCRRLGVSGGKWEYVEEGVLGAAYYFLVVEMKKLGYSKLIIGGTRPFLNDGVTKHKILLDACFVKNKYYPCLCLGLLRNPIGLRHFLTNNPFIFFDENEDLYCAIFEEIKDGKLSKECEDLIKSSRDGLDGTFFFTFDKLDNDEYSNSLKNYSFNVKCIEEMIIK